MDITFNGQAQHVADGATIADLLRQFEIEARYVAVEVNLQLVPRTQHAGYLLSAGDQLEVVTLVGGG